MTGDLFGLDLNCHACGKVHAGARIVALADGRQVSSYSEEWRLECEARAILALRGLERRRSELWHVEKARGKKAADELRAAMLAVCESQRSQRLAS